MRSPLINVARSLGTHPRDLIRAIDRGDIDAWLMRDDIIVDADRAETLNLDRWVWTPIHRWAADHGHKSVTVRAMVASGELDGVRDRRRRWVLERPSD